MNLWKGVIIAESLRDPTLINRMAVNNAHITQQEQDNHLSGTSARWHLYWVSLTSDEIEQLQCELADGWYAHFWTQDQILVLYNNAMFRMEKHDPSTWKMAIEHGLSMGIPEEQLDFPTDDSPGKLA